MMPGPIIMIMEDGSKPLMNAVCLLISMHSGKEERMNSFLGISLISV